MLSRCDVQIFSLSSSKCRGIREAPCILEPNPMGVLVDEKLHWLSQKTWMMKDLVKFLGLMSDLTN